jgi:hypothetical protein
MGEGGREVTYKNLSTEKLESMLPLTFQRKEKIERPCGSRCPLREREETVTYEQSLYRFDNFIGGRDVRTYQIYYREQYKTGAYRLYETGQHCSFRDALIEMCEKLAEAGIIEPPQEKLKEHDDSDDFANWEKG